MRHLAKYPLGTAAGAALRLALLTAFSGVGCAPTEQGADEPDHSMAPAGRVASVVPTNGLVGEWKLDESGGTTAQDTKNDNDATVQGGASFVAAHVGNGLDLNNGPAGTGGKHAQMPSDPVLDTVQKGNYTISAWFYPYTRPPNTGQANAFWAVVVKPGQNMGIVYNTAGRFVARHYLAGPTLETAQGSPTYPVKNWYHVVSVVNRTQGRVKIYVNGDSVGVATFPANEPAHNYGTTAFRIGRGVTPTTWAADGKVDQVRIYNRALNQSEIESLHEETAVAEDPTLRVGWMGMNGQVGKGPGDDYGDPIFKVVQWSPHAEGLGDVPGVLALAEEEDILIVAYTPGSATNFGIGTAFDSVEYRQQLDKLDTMPSFNAAAAAGRVFCYIGDEPNHPEWNNTWTPALFNYAARLNKVRWPGCLTFGRISPGHLADGWGGADPLLEYDALDYAWLQYAATHRKQGISIDSAVKEQKAIAANLDVGLALSMNMANAGLRTELGDGINPCWDTDGPGGSSGTGVVIGSPAGPGYTEGERVPCNQLGSVPTSQNLVASPAMVRRIADVARDDREIPFLLFWTYPRLGSGSGFLRDYMLRADFTAAFEYAIEQGELRTNFDGYRDPKP